MKVLVSDAISPQGVAKLREKLVVDVKTGLTEEELIAIIAVYDALIVRSATKVTRAIIDAGKKLKVIGRAGVGVDNIDIDTATENGVIVINAPEGNTISAAEHTIAMMTSLARNIPAASASLKAGEWKRNKFMGVELYQKILGVIGLGRIGSEVIKRAKVMGMQILAYDPHISVESAEKLGVTLTTPEEIYRNADFITLHTPKNKSTLHMIGAAEIAMMKDGVRIINCARGGLIDEAALCAALQEGKLAGAALDVFEEEPAVANPLCDLTNIIVTPHLGASTEEAQINVAVQVAEQIIKILEGEPPITAVNVPSIPPETLSEVKPYVPLLEKMGSLYAQIFNGQVDQIDLYYNGQIADYPVAPLTTSFLRGFLSNFLESTVNSVNAPMLAKQRGIKVQEIRSTTVENFTSLITVTVKQGDNTHTIAGTLFNNHDIRIVQIDQYRLEIIPSQYMLVTNHLDVPGVIGKVGVILGEENINIAGMQVGRKSIGGEAVMALQVDSLVPEKTLEKLNVLEGMFSVKFVQLS